VVITSLMLQEQRTENKQCAPALLFLVDCSLS
jgi:hypothetical protein